ncbi:hypothetical protein DFJ74DRAFT_670604 [Hyaloraphidium curvatum]|nr:hypothetical protein DFJ74DRAFT_670604 [Hyaloraphidium curvatum]
MYRPFGDKKGGSKSVVDLLWFGNRLVVAASAKLVSQRKHYGLLTSFLPSPSAPRPEPIELAYPASCLALSPSGRHLAVGCTTADHFGPAESDGVMHIFSVSPAGELEVHRRLHVRQQDLNEASFSPCGGWLLTLGADGTARMFDSAKVLGSGGLLLGARGKKAEKAWRKASAGTLVAELDHRDLTEGTLTAPPATVLRAPLTADPRSRQRRRLGRPQVRAVVPRLAAGGRRRRRPRAHVRPRLRADPHPRGRTRGLAAVQGGRLRGEQVPAREQDGAVGRRDVARRGACGRRGGVVRQGVRGGPGPGRGRRTCDGNPPEAEAAAGAARGAPKA